MLSMCSHLLVHIATFIGKGGLVLRTHSKSYRNKSKTGKIYDNCKAPTKFDTHINNTRKYSHKKNIANIFSPENRP